MRATVEWANPAEHVGRRLLLIEDNQGAREMLEKFLLIEEFDVRTAENGFQGIAVYHELKQRFALLTSVCLI